MIEPNSKKFKYILLLVFLVVVIFSLISSYITMNKLKLRSPIREIENDKIEVLENGLPNSNYIEFMKTKTFDEMKELAPEYTESPIIASKQKRDELIATAGLPEEPQNVLIVYEDDGLSSYSTAIFQGDLVTFSNQSSDSIRIIGKDNWKSSLPIEPDGKFSQRFDYLGEFEFIVEDTDIAGKIIVSNYTNAGED